jgi:hypothetical protein
MSAESDQETLLWVSTHRAPHFDELASLVVVLLFTEQGRAAITAYRKRWQAEGHATDHVSDLDCATSQLRLEFVSDGERPTPSQARGPVIGVGGGEYDDHVSGRVRASALGMIFGAKTQEITASLLGIFGKEHEEWVEWAIKYLKYSVIAYGELTDAEGVGYPFDVPSLLKTQGEVVSTQWDTVHTVFRFAPGGYTQAHAKDGIRLVGYLMIALLRGNYEGTKGVSRRVDEALAKALLNLPDAPWSKGTTLASLKQKARNNHSEIPLVGTLIGSIVGSRWYTVFAGFLRHLMVHCAGDAQERDGEWKNTSRGRLEQVLLANRPYLDARHFRCPWSLVGAVKLLALLDADSESGNRLFEASMVPDPAVTGESLADWAAQFLVGLWWQGQGHFQRTYERVEDDWKAVQAGRPGRLTAWQEAAGPRGERRQVAVWLGCSSAGPKALRRFHDLHKLPRPIAVVSILHGQVDGEGRELLRADGSRARGVAVMPDHDTLSRKETDRLCRNTAGLLRAANMRLTGLWPVGLQAAEAAQLLRASERLDVSGAEAVYVPSKPWRSTDEAPQGTTRAFMAFVGPSPSHPLAPQASAHLSDTAMVALVRLGIACTLHPQGPQVYAHAIGVLRDARMATVPDFEAAVEGLIARAERG